jgi:hypothetical protein
MSLPEDQGMAGPEVPDVALVDGMRRRLPAGKRKRSGAAPHARKLARALAGVAAATGASVPDENRMSPVLSVGLPISALARELGRVLSPAPIFRYGPTRDLVTVSEESGERRAMVPLRFVSWVEEWVTFVRDTPTGPVPVSISAELAARVLASDAFLAGVRVLDRVNPVRLPAWGDASRGSVRLLPPGYDSPTRTFTADVIPYPEGMLVDEALEFLEGWLGEFPFAKPEACPGQALAENRSYAVLVAGMLSTYCEGLLRGVIRPAIAIRANQPGSGKTLLARIIPAAVHGAVPVGAMPKDEAELGKSLTAMAADGRAFCIFDNLRGFLASAELEAALTSPRRVGRVLGRSELIDAPNEMLVVLTGNGLDLSPDLARRCLCLDLWCAEAVAERRIKAPIREDALGAGDVRAGLLAALWAVVAWWNAQGCPRLTGVRMASFEAFGDVIGAMVRCSNLADPMQPPEQRLDEAEAAWMKLFRALADGLPDGGAVEFAVDEVIDIADGEGILALLIGDPKSPKVAMGKRLAKWRGREFRDSQNRRFRFGHRHSELGSRHSVTNLEPAARAES